MTTSEKRNLTGINKIEKFRIILEKLTLGTELAYDDKVYILSIALIFINFYKKDKRHTSYREFAYYIVLKYSLQYEDYKPLYDLSIEFGFYPISKDIINKNLIDIKQIKDVLVDNALETYRVNDSYIETFEQYTAKSNLLSNEFDEVAYIAPTSFGKSSVIIDLIRINNYHEKKIAIIVPTKSLLMQTYKMIKDENFNIRLLIHDEMYDSDDSFIAIFTQERALRLLDNNPIFFDILFIDEAHNLMNNDSRSILLSRLIRRNKELNPSSKVIYLSPLVADKNNLKIKDSQVIKEEKIDFNVKEAEIFEYRLNGNTYQYNRFVNDFYFVKKYNDELEYIVNNTQNKNFIYLSRPVHVEELSNILGSHLPIIENESIEEVINLLKENVHENFYVVDLLKKGIIYLHGKLPDLIKEYLEYKFKNIKGLKYVVANSVILEGINFPIDNLFILNTRKLGAKGLTNLIGRVNRLDSIFLPPGNHLYKLLPKVHFVNNRAYNSKNGNMKNQIQLLRSRLFKDNQNNPILETFDIEKLEESKQKKVQQIIDNENEIFKEANNEEEALRQYCIRQSIHLYYSDFNYVNREFFRRIDIIKTTKLVEWNKLDVLTKIYALFIQNINELTHFEFKRLKNDKARNYYNRHISRSHKYSLKENINDMYIYFKEGNDKEFYIGKSYGEFSKETEDYVDSRNKVYVDLSSKTDKELVNLAIVKLQMEDSFVSFTLTKFIEMLYNYELITEQDYNLYIYGTEERKNIDLIKFGLNGNLISRLEDAGQLENISFDANGNIRINRVFNEFKESIDDFYRFEIERFL